MHMSNKNSMLNGNALSYIISPCYLCNKSHNSLLIDFQVKEKSKFSLHKKKKVICKYIIK